MSSRRIVGQLSERTETHVERKTIALRNAYPIGLRQWGMFITVFDDAVPANNLTYELKRGLSSTNKSDNNNWQELASGGGGGALPAGVVIHIGDYDATSDKLPGEVGAGAFVGTGAGGSIKKGNQWRLNPGSTTPGLYPQFSVATALQDNPTLPTHYDLKY